MPLPMATFFSEKFSKLSRPQQLSELGVDQIPKKPEDKGKMVFSALHDYLPTLYENFIKDGGYEIKGLTADEVQT